LRFSKSEDKHTSKRVALDEALLEKIDALAINAGIFELNRYWNLLLRSNST